MPLTAAALADELAGDPESLGYAALVAAGNDAGVAALLNAPRTPGLRAESWITEVILYRLLGPAAAEAFLQTLDGSAGHQAVPAGVRAIIARVRGWIAQAAGVGNGVDAGNAYTQETLKALPGVFSQAGYLVGQDLADFSAAVDAVCAYGVRPWSRAEVVGGEGAVVGHGDVARALGRG